MSARPVDREGGADAAPPRQSFLDEYWDWVAVALFLPVTLDMLTTMFAAAALGPGAEASPLMRWALGPGIRTLVAVNVLAVVLAVGFFYALREMLRRSPARYRRQFSLPVEAWLGLLVFAGLGCSRTTSPRPPRGLARLIRIPVLTYRRARPDSGGHR